MKHFHLKIDDRDWKQLLAFVQKEIFHILRDYRTLLIIIGMPIIQIILFGFTLSHEIRNARIGILDYANDEWSRSLVEQLDASQYFEIVEFLDAPASLAASLRKGAVKMVVVVPAHFADDLSHQNSAQLQLITDGIDPNLATSLINYTHAVVQDFQDGMLDHSSLPLQINITNRMLYNPQLRAEYTFVPGVIALVLMLICTMMTAVSIVREKEMGNMETLLVSPMRPPVFIVAKAAPYLVLSLLILTLILAFSVGLLEVPIRGSLALIYGVSMLFILASLGLGLAISTVTNSQQSALMLSLAGLLLPTMMFSGFMFPIESMPAPLQLLSHVIPAKWYFYSMQAVMIKGLGAAHIWKEILILTAFSLFFLVLSFKKFKPRLA